MIGRRMREIVKGSMRRVLEVGQRFGVNITPVHFYSDIPNFRRLRNDDSWRTPYTFEGVRGASVESQLAFVRDCCAPFAEAIRERDIHRVACAENGEAGYGRGEAAFLYAFVRRHRPAKIVQIGCGVSTAVMLMAAADEAGYSPEIVCVEPYPTAYLIRLADEGRVRLIREPAQAVPIETYTSLRSGDLFFVDSSHTLVPGSEVNVAILEVLPRLVAGVWSHFHDIQFPYNYRPTLMSTDLFFYREELLLHAFLAGNERCELACSLSWLHNERVEDLRAALIDYEPCAMDRGLKVGEGDFAVSAFLRAV